MLERAVPLRGQDRSAGWVAARRQQLLAQNAPLAVAVALLVAMLVIYIVLYAVSLGGFPGAFEAASITDHAMPLCLAALGQALVILTRGIDLSIGGMMDVTNSLAALKLHGGFGPEALWTAIILLVGAAGGLLNGRLVAFGRLQPILVTLGTFSIFQGVALWILPSPGGHVAGGYTSFFLDPTAPSALVWVVILGPAWAVLRRSRLGVNIYAIGNDENAARANSVPVLRTKVIAYVLAGMLAAGGGNRTRHHHHGRRRHRGRRVHAVLDRRRRRGWRFAVRRARQRGRGPVWSVRPHAARRRLVLRQHRPAVPPFYQGLFLVIAVAASILLGRLLVKRR